MMYSYSSSLVAAFPELAEALTVIMVCVCVCVCGVDQKWAGEIHFQSKAV